MHESTIPTAAVFLTVIASILSIFGLVELFLGEYNHSSYI